MTRLARYLRALADRLEPQTAHKPGCCTKCGERRHKHDKVTILAWQHSSCGDPTLAAAEAVPEPLRTYVLKPADEQPTLEGL